MSEGGRHVARREDDKCASHGSLFIGQSSGTQVKTEHGRRKAGGWGRGRWEVKRDSFRAIKNGFARSATLGKRAASGNGASGAAKFTPRGTTYVFVNVVVAPRYVARVQLGSGGLKISL